MPCFPAPYLGMAKAMMKHPALWGFCAALALSAFSLPAHADCVSDCQASTYCDYTAGWDCSSRLNACYQRECAKNNNSAPRYVGGEYGAIAYDEDSGAYGMADASKDKDSAKKSAMRYCSKHGKNCEIVETFSNTCAAIARSVKGDVAWADDDDKRTAAEDAIKRCNRKADEKNCHITLMHCYAP
ncbi:MAG: DUF4189 domain-containing protein [Alphaproteobacteria bacterium]|nr:DUF4189 domain-containing protein [Alphaproteobacteria bacterium]